jgi:hypothetical protein
VGSFVTKFYIDKYIGSTPENYIKAIAQREINAIQQLKKLPRPSSVVGFPGGYLASRQSKLTALEDYLKVTKYMLPHTYDLEMPVLWHRDLNLDNIFVNPNRPTEAISILDWQSSYVGPLFEQVSRPAFIEFDGPKYDGKSIPALPTNFNELSAPEKKYAKELLGDQALYMLYQAQLAKKNKPAHLALQYKETMFGAKLLSLVNIIFNEGEILLQGELIQAAQPEIWKRIVGENGGLCPLSYSEKEILQQQENELKWLTGVELMNEILEALGGAPSRDWDGSVRNEDSEQGKQALEMVRRQFIEHHAKNCTDKERDIWAKAWPFNDSS